MTFTPDTIENFARWAAEPDGTAFASPPPKNFTLGAAIELACRREGTSAVPGADVIDEWTSRHEELRIARALLRASAPCAITRAQDGVWLALPTKESLTSDAAALFLRAFTDALKGAGFSVDLAYALAGALEAMTDNLGQHCFDAVHRRGGLAAFRIRHRRMAFVVADLGRGALASLHENPQWQSLTTHHAAIQSIVTQHASRRVGLGPGEGFKQLFRSLAALDGELRFRSGDATFEIKGTLDSVQGAAGFSPPIPGLLVSVRCKLT